MDKVDKWNWKCSGRKEQDDQGGMIFHIRIYSSNKPKSEILKESYLRLMVRTEMLES